MPLFPPLTALPCKDARERVPEGLWLLLWAPHSPAQPSPASVASLMPGLLGSEGLAGRTMEVRPAMGQQPRPILKLLESDFPLGHLCIHRYAHMHMLKHAWTQVHTRHTHSFSIAHYLFGPYPVMLRVYSWQPWGSCREAGIEPGQCPACCITSLAPHFAFHEEHTSNFW